MKTKPNSVWHFLTIAFLLLANTACEKQEEATLPDVITIMVSDIGTNGVVSGGQVNSDGGKPVTEKGVFIGKTENPSVDGIRVPMGEGTGFFSQPIENLDSGTIYHLCAYAVNEIGTAYGSVKAFKTLEVVTDIDGNSYGVVDIGNQTWMAENLKTSKYRNGDPIPNITNEQEWFDLASGAFCYYNNEQSNNLIYGKLYNWHGMMDERGICPEGWEPPDKDDWMELIAFAGGISNAGVGLKHKGFDFFESPNVGANNSTGFTALPGGYRVSNGFFGINRFAVFWSATVHDEHDNAMAYYITLGYNSQQAFVVPMFKSLGHSVRCIKKEN